MDFSYQTGILIPGVIYKLIYRGQTFSVNARQISDYRKPYAINWRY